MTAADTARRALEQRLAELRRAIEETEESRRPVELDQTSVGRLSRMDAMQAQAMALATRARQQEEMRRIEQALRRIKAGDYGFCIVCGEAIAPKRLAFDPTVPTCIGCASGGNRSA